MFQRQIVLILAFAAVCSAVSNFTFFEQDPASRILEMKAGTYNPYREFNSWVNELFYETFQIQQVPDVLISKLGPEVGYYTATYLRDLAAGFVVYWATAGIWAFVIYIVLGNSIFTSKGRSFPTWATFFDQMALANASLFIYAGLPILSEFLIESKITRAYYFVDEVGGWGFYTLYLAIYLVLVEIGVYWMHRTLHENKWMFKHLHALHHKYNKDTTMTPWCSIAFNPIDGMLQASPYVFFLFFVPVHFYTHLGMVFFTGVWATNIHDSVPGDSEPIMGAKYHTVHHTHYHYNYGQFFIFCDYFWGTLRLPKDRTVCNEEEEIAVELKKQL